MTDDVEAHNLFVRASKLIDENRLEEALSLADRGLEHQSWNWWGHGLRGLALKKLNRPTESRRSLIYAVDLIYDYYGETEPKLVPDHRDGLEWIFPAMTEIYASLPLCEAERDEWLTVRLMMKRAALINPTEDMYWWTLARASLALGQPDSALKELNECVRLYPNCYPAYVQLYRLHRRSYNYIGAFKDLWRALTTFKSFVKDMQDAGYGREYDCAGK